MVRAYLDTPQQDHPQLQVQTLLVSPVSRWLLYRGASAQPIGPVVG